MPGLIGFYTFGEGRENWDASHFIRYGLSALQGRGQESISLSTIGPGRTLHTLGEKGESKNFSRKTGQAFQKASSESDKHPPTLMTISSTLKHPTSWF